jgi:hypothetical protein
VRLDQLARWVDPEGQESFGHLTPHPRTEGVYGTDATVGDYLDQQGAAPFFDVGDRYGAVYQRMVERLEELDADELQYRSSWRNDVDQPNPAWRRRHGSTSTRQLFEFCQANRRPMPGDIEGTLAIHIEAIETWVASLGNEKAGMRRSSPIANNS